MKHHYQTYQQFRAPDLLGDYWFNSEPISIRELEGRPVVIFFWDFTSLQSKRLIPFINGLHALYMEFGLVCVGVHSCEFEFGKSAQRLEQEIKKNLILFPVLADNSRMITEAYRISELPTICLIDNKGNMYDVRSHAFVPEQIERSLQYLLRQSGYHGELPLLLNPEFEEHYSFPEGDVHEIFAGYAHGALGNPEGYSPELSAEYRDPLIYLDEKFYAHGIWKAERDSFTYNGEPGKGYIVYTHHTDDSHILVGSSDKATLTVTMNDKPLSLSMMGNDIEKDKKGHTFLKIDSPKLSALIRNNRNKKGIVKLFPLSPGISIYMFSFSERSSDHHFTGDSAIPNN